MRRRRAFHSSDAQLVWFWFDKINLSHLELRKIGDDNWENWRAEFEDFDSDIRKMDGSAHQSATYHYLHHLRSNNWSEHHLCLSNLMWSTHSLSWYQVSGQLNKKSSYTLKLNSEIWTNCYIHACPEGWWISNVDVKFN